MTAEAVGQLLQILGYVFGIGGLGVTGFFGLRVARENRKARQDRTPADSNEATRIANDLIFRLLDRANEEVERYQELVDTVSEEARTYKALAGLVPGLERDRDRAKRERDRLRKAIHYLEAKARVVGSISYGEVVEWARAALDPDAESALFDVDLTEVLPDGLEETVTTLT